MLTCDYLWPRIGLARPLSGTPDQEQQLQPVLTEFATLARRAHKTGLIFYVDGARGAGKVRAGVDKALTACFSALSAGNNTALVSGIDSLKLALGMWESALKEAEHAQAQYLDPVITL